MPLRWFRTQGHPPVPLSCSKVGSLCSIAKDLVESGKGAHGEFTRSFDLTEHVVETAPDDREIYIFMVYGQRQKRLVMILSAPDVKSFAEWSLWLSYASKSVLKIHYNMDRLISKGVLARVLLGRDLRTVEYNAVTLLANASLRHRSKHILNARLNLCIRCSIPILFGAMMFLIPIYKHIL